MVHSQQVEEVGSRGKIGMLRGQSPMMEILLWVSLKSKTNQTFRRESPTKFLLISARLTRTGCLTPTFEEENVVVQKVRNLVVPNVVRNM